MAVPGPGRHHCFLPDEEYGRALDALVTLARRESVIKCPSPLNVLKLHYHG
jgi:hypothetical protein